MVCTNNNIVTCFETIEYRIIYLYHNSDYHLAILYEGILGPDEKIFLKKGIHLKEEIGVFMYYTPIDSKTPLVSII